MDEFMLKDSEVVNCEQRTPEWLEVRSGRLTASTVASLFTPIKGELKKPAIKAAARTAAAELMLRDQEQIVYENYAMQRGIQLEPNAKASAEQALGMIFNEVGFVKNKLGYFGCSPDGFSHAENVGLEIKCPLGKNYINDVEGAWVKYRFQCIYSAMLLGVDSWYLIIYHPSVTNQFIRKIEVEPFKENMLEMINLYSIEFEKALNILEMKNG